MSFSKKVVSQVREEFDRRLSQKKSEQQARISEAELRVPELISVNAELGKTGIKIFKASFGDPSTLSERIKAVKDENLALQEKRASLLAKAGFGADYLEMKYDCSLCNDTGKLKNGTICSCYRNALIKAQIEMSGFSRVIEKCSFDNFDLNYYPDKEKMAEALEYLREYASSFSLSSDSVLLVGGTGLGKTHLSASVARELISKGHFVICESAENIFSNYNKERFAQDESDLICDKYLECELLIIDDLGAEAVTQYSVSCLYNLINTRINEGKPTILSTNLSSNDIRKIYNDRITSRLFGEFVIIVFTGNDIRKLKK